MELKTEIWNGYEIRFVEKECGDWWAILKDISESLELDARFVARRLPKDVISKHPLSTKGGLQELLIVNEFGIYETIFSSRKPEAKEFKRWVFGVLKDLRESTGLEGFQVFRMMDKKHQIGAMRFLNINLPEAKTKDYIKANTIANKAISTKHGYLRMIKKDDMTPHMLEERQEILDDTIQLIVLKDKFGIDVSVSDKIYDKYCI